MLPMLKMFIFVSIVSVFAVDEYGRLSAKLNTLETRIREQRQSIVEMAIDKNKTTEANQKLQIIEKMKGTNQALNKDIDEYNDIKSKIEHRYPKRKADVERRYRPQKRQSIEEIESNVGLIKNIESVENFLDIQYGKAAKNKEVRALEKKIKKQEVKKQQEPKKLRLIN